VHGTRLLSAIHEDFRVFFELLPHALRHEALHARLRGLYDWYVQRQLSWLAQLTGRACLESPILIGLSELFGTVIDGLAIQETIGRHDYDSRRPYESSSLLPEASLPALLAALPESDDGKSQ
jgi:hypothetical protein